MSVRIEREEQPSGSSVAIVTLDDPDRRNALSEQMITSIIAAFDELDTDPLVGAIVLTASPPAFCAGAPLTKLQDVSDAQAPGGDVPDRRAVLLEIYEGFLSVDRAKVPTVAAVNGAAVGAGVNLAMACDLRIASRSARFDTRFLSLGLHPGGGHTWSLTSLVGTQTAEAMVLFGEVVSGEEAARLGLAWTCVEDEELLESALTLARRAAAIPPSLTRRTKATFRALPAITSKSAAMELELEAQLWSLEATAFRSRSVRSAAPGPAPGSASGS